MWVLSLVISTIFMAIYVRKYHKPEGIIAVYVIYIALSQIMASKLVVIGPWIAPGGTLVFPFLYQLTDTMNEHFGQKETHKMIIIAFITQVLMVLFIYFGNNLVAAETSPISDETWLSVFSLSFGITAGSWISYLITNNLDAIVFSWIKKLTKGKALWVRSVLSDVPMLLLDSFLFTFLAFGVFQGLWFLVVPVAIGQTAGKWIFGIVDTPFIYLDRWIVKTPKLSALFGEIPKEKRAVVILSGGVDSTTLTYDLKNQGFRLHAISFDYGQKHAKELEMASKTAAKLGISHKLIDLAALKQSGIFGKSALTSSTPVPESSYDVESMQTTVVPNRNMLMLSIATSYAISLGIPDVFYGAHSGDHAIYPDCRPEFVEAMDQATRLCDYLPVKIRAPYLELSKAEIVKKGLDLEINFADSWSCYEGKAVPCGKCGTCVERIAAFRTNGVQDPLMM